MGGAAGIILLSMAVCLVKTIIALIKFLFWNTKTKTKGKIVKFKDKIIKYENEEKGKISLVKYLYTIEYEINGKKHQIGYSEKILKDGPSKIQVGDEVPIYVDKKTLQIQSVRELKKELIYWSLIFGGLTLVLLVIIFLTALIANA